MKYTSIPTSAKCLEKEYKSVELFKLKAFGKTHYLSNYIVYPVDGLPRNAKLVKKPPDVKIFKLKNYIVVYQKSRQAFLFISKHKYISFMFLSGRCIYHPSCTGRPEIIPTPDIVKQALAMLKL